MQRSSGWSSSSTSLAAMSKPRSRYGTEWLLLLLLWLIPCSIGGVFCTSSGSFHPKMSMMECGVGCRTGAYTCGCHLLVDSVVVMLKTFRFVLWIQSSLPSDEGGRGGGGGGGCNGGDFRWSDAWAAWVCRSGVLVMHTWFTSRTSSACVIAVAVVNDGGGCLWSPMVHWVGWSASWDCVDWLSSLG